MPRSMQLKPQEQASQSGFFQKKQEPAFFKGNEADNSIQRLSTPKDKEEPATNDGRMKQDKDIQRCPCEESE